MELSQLLIVDNNVSAFGSCIDQGVPILPFDHKDCNDNELLQLAEYLEKLAELPADKVQAANRAYFDLQELRKHDDAVSAFKIICSIQQVGSI